MTQLVLASASSVRARLLQSAGIAFELSPADIDEDAIKQSLLAEGAKPRDVAAALAERKALCVSASRPNALVLGADQVMDFHGELLSKCQNMGDARTQFVRLRGRPHRLISAIVMARDGAVLWRHVDEARLWMRDFSDAFLDDYLAREGEATLTSVGGYRLEDRGVQLFERIEGDYFSILGLPLVPLLTALRDQGVIDK
jgi:septum formation protein